MVLLGCISSLRCLTRGIGKSGQHCFQGGRVRSFEPPRLQAKQIGVGEQGVDDRVGAGVW